MKIILASGSPRRKELLEQAGYTFTIEVSDADEQIQAKNPEHLVEELSRRKAFAVARQHLRGQNPAMDFSGKEPLMVIGADTVVALEGQILGKPAEEEDAVRMLQELAGKTHQVYTGVSLYRIEEGEVTGTRTFFVCTDVTMRPLDEEEIRAYVRTGEPMDKAGAYGIQGKAAVFIEGIRGDYYNVVGLPICALVQQMNGMAMEKSSRQQEEHRERK